MITKPQAALTLPAVVREWSSAHFWKTGFLEFDSLHVNLGFVGKGMLAGNWLINLETGEKQLAAQSALSSSTISHLACTNRLDLVTFNTKWNVATRPLGWPESPLKPFENTKESQGSEDSTKRLLAVSPTGRFAAICSVTIFDGYSRSGNALECLCRNLGTSLLRVQFSSGNKITATVFSNDESMLAVSSYNGETLADTTRV